MNLSVLIATCNRADMLRACLAAILAGTRQPDEIVVADQSDGPDTQAVVAERARACAGLRYLRLERKGKSHALNQAAELSRGEVLAFTDDDVEVDRGWLATLERLAARHAQTAGFCGRVLAEPGTDPADYENLVLGTRERWITRRTHPLTPGFVGANVAVRRAKLLEVGGFNEAFGPGTPFHGAEDAELAYRLARRGERILFAPEWIVYHSGWRRERENRPLKLGYTLSLGAFAGYYLRRGHLRPTLYLGRKLAYKARQLLWGLLSRQPQQVADARLQLGGLSRGFVQGLHHG